MENLIRPAIPDSPYFPEVNFDYSTGICELTGESYMEETYKFYAPLVDWLNNYIQGGKPITFNFRLTYFNTSTSRLILEILEILEKYKLAGGSVIINWYYRSSDPDMVEEIEDFQRELSMEINMIAFY
jgi:hypothetical protein